MRGDVSDHTAPANSVSTWIARIETMLVAMASAAMAAIMCVVTLDVMMRYIFSAPLSWSYSLIGLYLVGAAFFLALSDTLQDHGHVALDIFVPRIPFRLLHSTQALGYAASAVFVAIIAWLGYERAHDAFLSDDRIAASVAWPTWVAHALLAIGMAVLGLRCLYRAVFHVASAVAGRALVELPPPPQTDVITERRGK